MALRIIDYPLVQHKLIILSDKDTLSMNIAISSSKLCSWAMS